MAESANTDRRYNIPVPTADLEALLVKCYESEVRSTAIAYRADTVTADRLHLIAKWLTNPDCKNSLILCGGIGSGKSTTLRSIARAIDLIRKAAKERKAIDKPAFHAEFSNKDVLTIHDRLQVIKPLTVFSSSACARRAEECAKVEFLGIDDFGCESTVVMDYGTRTTPLINLLYYRYDCKLPTVITTNLDLVDVEKKYDKRLADRMHEDYDILAFPNPSYRQ